MIQDILKKVFGTSHQRQIKKIQPRVDAINAMEPEIKKLSDAQLKARTAQLREKLDAGATLEDILVPAFAVAREAVCMADWSVAVMPLRDSDWNRGKCGAKALQAMAMGLPVMIVELIGGLLANSLALIADAAHMLTDVAALGLSLFVLWFSRRPARPQKTYGYLRLEILAALINGVALVAISCVIFWQAYQRIRVPEPVAGPLMLGVAVIGLLVNVAAAWLLHSSASHSLNLRGAYLHIMGDLIGSAGAILAAVLIITTGMVVADPVISIVVGLLILFSSWKLVRESLLGPSFAGIRSRPQSWTTASKIRAGLSPARTRRSREFKARIEGRGNAA